MSKLNLRLFRMITGHIGQFIAVTLVIAIGLMTYVAFTMSMINLENSVELYYDESNFADIYVELVKVPERAVKEIAAMPGVKLAQGRISFDVPLKIGDTDEKVTVRVISEPEAEDKVNDVYHFDKGRIRNRSKDVYVYRTFANARGIQVGDTITPQILGETYNLTVQSVTSSPEFVYLMENEMSLLPAPSRFGVVWVAEEFAMKSFGMNAYYNQILIQAEEGQDVERLMNRVEDRLERYGVRRIYQQKDQLSARIVHEEIDGGKKSAQTIPFIFLGVAAAIMGVMISRTVRNDRTSIGVFKSMGYTNGQIMWHYTKYCTVIGLVGATIGIVLGSLTAAGMTDLYASQFFSVPYLRIRLYPQYMAMAIVLSVIFSIVAGLWGSRGVLKVHPADSMRPEPPRMGKHSILERTWIWRYISFSEKIAVRNLLRVKKRTVFIILGIALTYSITLMPMFQSSAFDTIFVDHYSKFLRMDYNINFSQPVSEHAVNEIQSLVEVSDIAPKLEYPFQIKSKWRKKIVTVIGVPRKSNMYGFVDTNGNTVDLPEEGVFMSEGLAKLLDVQAGDLVKVETFIPGREDVFMPVERVIKQQLGSNVYMDLSYMQRQLLDDNLINGVYVNTHDPIKKELQNIKRVASVQSMEDLVNIYQEFLQLTLASVGILIVFSGILGFAIVYNSTIMSILERRLEFSSLRVMGLSQNEIFFILLRENVIMTLFGILLGIPIGTAMLESVMAAFSTELYSLEVEFTWSHYGLTAILTLIFVLIAQVATYSRIKRLDFIEALKNRMT